MPEVVHTDGVGIQRRCAIDGAIERQGQFLDHVAIGSIELIDNALQQRVGALDNGVGIGARDVDVTVGHHGSTRTGVAVGLVGP